MKKNFKHVLLGTFIDESLKCANLTMTHLCKETGMGKGEDMKLHYYESILNFYCDSLTEEELLEKIREWTLRYLWYRKKREEEEGNMNE